MRDIPDILKELADAYNHETTEFNGMVAEVDEAKGVLTKYKKAFDDQRVAAADMRALIETQQRALVTVNKREQSNASAKTELKSVTEEAKRLRKERKALKEKVKNLQELNKALQKGKKEPSKLSQTMKGLSDKKTDVGITMTDKVKLEELLTIYHNVDDAETLIVYPNALTIAAFGAEITKTQVLLYTEGTGTYYSLVLDSDDEVVVSDSHRGAKGEEAYTPEPSERVREAARSWLYKVNRIQEGQILVEDTLEIM